MACFDGSAGDGMVTIANKSRAKFETRSQQLWLTGIDGILISDPDFLLMFMFSGLTVCVFCCKLP